MSLINSRYSNLYEYKDKIITGTQLPSYVRSLLNENQFWSSDSHAFKQLMLSANKPGSSASSSSVNEESNIFQFNSNHRAETDNVTNTTDYMNLLVNTRINNDLDHISFDTEPKLAALAKQEEDDLEDFLDDSNINAACIGNNPTNTSQERMFRALKSSTQQFEDLDDGSYDDSGLVFQAGDSSALSEMQLLNNLSDSVRSTNAVCVSPTNALMIDTSNNIANMTNELNRASLAATTFYLGK
jgi:hypothetical protein